MTPPPCIAPDGRELQLDRLEAEVFDVLVVGGGITGAGVARDASLRGLSVALLEARDFAAGTSSRSSKLIHGGLRYLAQGEVGLVRHTALERAHVHAMAPHLAEPCWMVVPVHSRAGLLKFRAAIGAYEALGSVAEADRHRVWHEAELASNEPAIDRERFPHACVYREYTTDDARLVLANLRGATALGALVASRVAVESLLVEGGRAAGALARCGESGRALRVRARCIVNAAGPWVEDVARLEGTGEAPHLHLSKGVHVVLPASRLPVRNIVILTARDRRSIFAVRRDEVVYVGTTDTSYGPHADEFPPITRGDVEYLLEPLSHVFSVPPLAPAECVSAWSGLRPLVAEPGKEPSEISRRDEVTLGPEGVVTVAGGKLTGFRRMATSVMEVAAEVLGALPDRPEGDPPLPGGDFDGDLAGLAARLEKSAGLAGGVASRLARLYGTESDDVARLGAEPLLPGAPLLVGEVDWAVRVEGALRVEDVAYRRTRAAYYLPEAREAMLAPVAERMATLLGWSRERRDREIAETLAHLRGDLDFSDGSPDGGLRGGPT